MTGQRNVKIAKGTPFGASCKFPRLTPKLLSERIAISSSGACVLSFQAYS